MFYILCYLKYERYLFAKIILYVLHSIFKMQKDTFHKLTYTYVIILKFIIISISANNKF